MAQDLFFSILNRLEDQMEDHKKQTNELLLKVESLHETVSANLNDLKLAQSRCDSKWNVSEKFFGWTLGSGSLVGLITWLFSTHPPTGK